MEIYDNNFLTVDPTQLRFSFDDIKPSQGPGTQLVKTAKRRQIVLGVQVSFFAGVLFVVAFFVSFLLLDIWFALFFVPGFISAYGLFWSSGKQLAIIDGEFPVVSPVPETPFPAAYFEAPRATEGAKYGGDFPLLATPSQV